MMLFEHVSRETLPDTSNEWYTPGYIIEAARAVMGSIDLDPASCEIANKTVKATRYYTKLDNGLVQPWYGNVWLNPPYSKINNRSGMERWINRLINEYQHNTITQAILLTTCKSDTQWFIPLWDYLICFATHCVHFFKPINNQIRKDSRSSQMFGTCFTYLGPNEQTFIDIFSKFGVIAKRVSPPTLPYSTLWEDVCR